ncbi:unnamed protein product [Sphacelaria rigidula]
MLDNDHGDDEDDEDDGERLTRYEALRERVEEAGDAIAAAARLAMVVLRGSMWQPLELVADYFGEATAFYFAWMGFYTQGLVVPSIFGVIVFAAQVFVHKEGVSSEYRGTRDLAFWANMLINPALYGITIPILYQICKKLGVFLNNLENHKTENKFRNALIVKVNRL